MAWVRIPNRTLSTTVPGRLRETLLGLVPGLPPPLSIPGTTTIFLQARFRATTSWSPYESCRGECTQLVLRASAFITPGQTRRALCPAQWLERIRRTSGVVRQPGPCAVHLRCLARCLPAPVHTGGPGSGSTQATGNQCEHLSHARRRLAPACVGRCRVL